jgi:hypothetical protein
MFLTIDLGYRLHGAKKSMIDCSFLIPEERQKIFGAFILDGRLAIGCPMAELFYSPTPRSVEGAPMQVETCHDRLRGYAQSGTHRKISCNSRFVW